MVIIPQTLHPCNATRRFISSILDIRPVTLSHVRYAVRWQMIYTIENLMALCRKHHEMYGDRKQWKDWLQKVHDLKIKRE